MRTPHKRRSAFAASTSLLASAYPKNIFFCIRCIADLFFVYQVCNPFLCTGQIFA